MVQWFAEDFLGVGRRGNRQEHSGRWEGIEGSRDSRQRARRVGKRRQPGSQWDAGRNGGATAVKADRADPRQPLPTRASRRRAVGGGK